MAGLVTMVLVNVHMATQAQLADLVSPLFKEHTYLIFCFLSRWRPVQCVLYHVVLLSTS